MSVYDNYEMPASTGGLFFKFEDGKTNQVRIASPEPVVFESVFNEGQENESISTKYGYIIINREIESAQIMQIPGTAFKQILAYAKDPDYGDPMNYDLKITRTGKGLETEYKIIAGRSNSPITDEEQEAAAQINLKDVISKGKGVQHVFYLSEATKPADGPLNRNDVTMGKSLDEAQEEQDDEIQDKPIDLSEIPF